MTPEEILQDLHDIHLPEQTAGAANDGLVLWPLALIAAAIVFTIWLAWRRRSAWRRDVVQHLDGIEHEADKGQVLEGWVKLATLLRRIAVRLGNRGEIAGLIGDAWLERLDSLFQTESFTKGPGRGVIKFPYKASGESDRREMDDAASQLKATIDDVRKHLPHLKATTWSS